MKQVSVAIIVTSLLVSGCVPAILAGAGAAGTVAVQERSTGNAVDDTSIRVAINAKYINQENHDIFKNVDIRVSEGRVLLTGDVDLPESKVEAVRLAWEVKGVRELMDEIQVNDQAGIMDYAGDAWIANQIRTKLLFEKNLRSVNYNVEVVNDVVYLLGIAQNQEELDKALYIASTTSHVKKVVNHVVLKDDPRRH